MIKQIVFKNIYNLPNEWECNVPAIKMYEGKPIKFTDGINVLVGPNGCGKSTIISDIAKYHFCYDTGLTKFTNETARKLMDPYNDNVLRDGLEITSDGCVAYIGEKLFNGNTDLNSSFMGFAGFAEIYKLQNSSTGETSVRSFTNTLDKIYHFDFNNNLNRILTQGNEESPWNRYTLALTYLKNGYNNLNKYIKKDSTYRRPTILIDEVDSHMDIINTIYSTKILVEQVSKFHQLIIATHNPLIFTIDNINFIELEEGYLEKVKKELSDFGIKYKK